MFDLKISTKHLAIDKANSSMVITVAIATVIGVFALISTKTLLGQAAYQRRVLGAKRQAVQQLQTDIKNVNTLESQYTIFAAATPNVIGGSSDPNGSGPKDGDNPRIVLDALPSSYDFPALTSSLEKILVGSHLNVQSIGGTDQEPTSVNGTVSSAAATAANPAATAAGTSIPIGFSFSGTSNYDGSQVVIKDFERSIRPFYITNLSLSGSSSSMSVSVSGNTYYQPATTLVIGKKVVK